MKPGYEEFRQQWSSPIGKEPKDFNELLTTIHGLNLLAEEDRIEGMVWRGFVDERGRFVIRGDGIVPIA